MDWARAGSDWPNRTASRFVEAGGLRWHVQCSGDPARPALLLLHGTGASTHSWRDVLPRLADRFFVVAPDLPGHGFSSTPADPAAFTLPGMARAVAALLSALRITPRALVGHSAGAAVAVQMALDGLAAPASIVGINAALLPMPGAVGAMFSPLARTLVLNPLVPRFFAWTAAWPGMLARLLDGTGSAVDDTGRRLYGRLVRDHGHVAAALAMMAGWDLEGFARRLERLKVPLVLVVGEADRTLPPRMARDAVAMVPGARVVSWPGLGHLAHEERPQALADLLHGLLEAPVPEPDVPLTEPARQGRRS